MKTKRNNLAFLLLPIGLFLLFASSCKKDDNTPGNPTNGKTMAVFNSNLTYGTLTDIDGNEYKTIKIGTQTWMAENLRTFKYNDGTPIPNVKGKTEWANLSSGAYCTYGNTSKNDSIATFGCMYNWFAINTGKLAPKGWHVATKDEWEAMEDYLIANGYNYDGTTSGNKIAKAIASTYSWIPDPDLIMEGSIANNDYPAFQNKSGFTALGAGYRAKLGGFFKINYEIGWWSPTEIDDEHAHYFGTASYINLIIRLPGDKNDGFYVRCIKD